MSTPNFFPDPLNFQPDVYLFPEEFNDSFRIKLRQYLNDIAIALNAKENAFYFPKETPTGGLFIPTFNTNRAQNATYRAVYRTEIDFGALPNTSTKTVAHGITTTENWSLIKLFGGATDPGASTITSGLSIPFASPTLANNISLEIDATNVIITTGSNRTAYTRTFITIEYIKEI